MKYLALIFTLIPLLGFSQVLENDFSEPYPFGNPVIRHMYTADAAPHVMPDGRVWMVTSVDHLDGGGYATMHRYHLFSSANMKDWHDHGECFHIHQLEPKAIDETEQQWAAWAPDMVYRNGKYYLYIPVRILYPKKTRPNGGRWVETHLAVAVADKLGDRFEVINPKIDATRGIDPSVFIDDDGTPYMYWGSHDAAVLKENMYELATEPVKLEVGTDRFMEAAWMNKVGDEYHLSYHTKYDWKLGVTPENHDDPERLKSELWYSVSDSPWGPFELEGTLNYELGVNVDNGPRHPEGDFVPWKLTQSNHGGIVEFHGQEYLFYHTSALSSWLQTRFKDKGTWTQRSVCVDKLNYDEEGKVIPIQQTIEGVEAVIVDQPFEIDLRQLTIAERNGFSIVDNKIITTEKTSWAKIEDVDLGTGYYYYEAEIYEAKHPFKIELRLDAPDGKLLGTAQFQQPANIKEGGVMDCRLREANGKHDLYVLFVSDKASNSFRGNTSRIFAGSPLPLDQ